MTNPEEAVEEHRLDETGETVTAAAAAVRVHLAPPHLQVLRVRAARRAAGLAAHVGPQRTAAARAARRVPPGLVPPGLLEGQRRGNRRLWRRLARAFEAGGWAPRVPAGLSLGVPSRPCPPGVP